MLSAADKKDLDFAIDAFVAVARVRYLRGAWHLSGM